MDENFLLELNKHFNFEDLAILLTGKRFETAVEKDHLHEKDLEFTNKVEQVHQELAKEFGWKVVNGNQAVEDVSREIWEKVKGILST